jgi:3-hydroxyisobutyrate dehydrogenase-like beta-hydroxyacid dehydrogenase
MPEVAPHNEALPRVAFVGFGEAAQAFWAGWKSAAAPPARAFDIATDMPSRRPEKLDDYRRTGMDGAATLADALREAEVVFSLVTADNAQAAASATAGMLPREPCGSTGIPARRRPKRNPPNSSKRRAAAMSTSR